MSREMSNSGIPWIGEIPKEWSIHRFKYAGILQKGKLPTETNIDGNGLPIIGASEMLGKTFRQFSTDVGLPECNESDILILWDGANAGMVSSNLRGIVSSTAAKYTCIDSRCYSKYVYYLLKGVEGYFKDKVFGTTIPHMNSDYINDVPLLIPSLLEQQKIASILDKKCAEIDAMISLQEKIIDELKAYKQSVIAESVTKGLNPDVPMKDSGIRWIKQIPHHWNAITPKALFALRKEKAREGERQLTASQQYGVIYQDEYTEITGNKVVTVMKDFDILKHVEVGDFVISMRSFQGGLEYSTKSGSISSAYVMLIPNLNYVYPRFYRWLFKSMGYINALQSTSNMVRDGQAMRYSNFAQVPLYTIPIDEQKDIADYLDKKCEEIEKILLIKQSKVKLLQEYKKSIIYEYVTGKKEVIE